MKGFKTYLIVGSLIIVVYLIAQYSKPQPTNWKPTYLSTDKVPFGTYILRQQIKDIFPNTSVKNGQSTIYQTLTEKPAGQSNLLILASQVKMDSLDFREMINYIERGNQVFIAAFQIEGILSDTLKLQIGSDFGFQSSRKFPINFVNKSLKRELDYYFDKGIASQYFEELDSARAIVLGEQQGTKANFVAYKFGKGTLYLSPNPQLFTNYSLLREDGRDYAAKALSYLPPTKTLLWNEYFTRPQLQDQSMLRVLFAHERLKWAYCLALAGLTVFVLYGLKRRQRIIPVINPLANTSVEFVKVVGRVYYQQRDNKDIASKKVTYLLAYIRNRYRLKTTTLDAEFVDSLIKISNAKADTIRILFDTINTLDGAAVNDQQLIDLNKTIEKFYKQDQQYGTGNL